MTTASTVCNKTTTKKQETNKQLKENRKKTVFFLCLQSVHIGRPWLCFLWTPVSPGEADNILSDTLTPPQVIERPGCDEDGFDLLASRRKHERRGQLQRKLVMIFRTTFFGRGRARLLKQSIPCGRSAPPVSGGVLSVGHLFYSSCLQFKWL